MTYLTAPEIIAKLNATIPKDQMPKSGKITRQAFAIKKKRSGFKFHTRDGKDFYVWEEVAPVYNIRVESAKVKKERLNLGDSEFEELLKELKELTDGTVTPNQFVEVEKKFWEAQTKKLEYKEKVGELIPMEKIITTMSLAMPVLKNQIYKVPSLVKTSFPETPVEVVDEIHELISLAFHNLQMHEFYQDDD